MRKLILILILVFAAVLIFRYGLYNFNKDDLAKHLNRWGVDINITGLTLTDFSGSDSGGLAKETVTAGGENMVLKMTKIKTDAPGKYIEDKKFLLESLFLPTTAPYPGVITDVTECPEEFKPKIQEAESETIYTLFAGERFTYGVCAQDLIAYYSTYGIFDCKEKGIFEVQVFSKTRGEPETIVQSFSCG